MSKLLVPKQLHPEKGFTIVEVLVSLLITLIFFAVAMQAVLIAAVYKARAEQYDEAITWIQKDLEFVKQQAIDYKMNAEPDSLKLTCEAANADDGFAAGLLNEKLGGTPRRDGPRLIGGKAFILTISADYNSSTDPFKLLKLTYTVQPQDGGSEIAKLYTEVIPNAVFKCPEK